MKMITVGASTLLEIVFRLCTDTLTPWWSWWGDTMVCVSTAADMLDLGIPAMTKCCNQLDVCYDTCGRSKYDCDSKFRSCLHGICSDLNKSLGFVSKVQACESVADTLYNTVWTLGCRPYMNSQRAACVCEGEERDEL
ncbi:group XIIB secretory phospholipase A2-like protein isoform X5 [Siniperca chuatsi]|uniref:group XIIB secretory phospholipase A2-like protein isoform X5 n=1 Tax=Siniperca chuatsi TaxID=119488 RepID=UPI001CE1BA8D|nr:group XIIB secretory phospholipase A2-like protein isoform X5 [Siniperca chuatsi]